MCVIYLYTAYMYVRTFFFYTFGWWFDSTQKSEAMEWPIVYDTKTRRVQLNALDVVRVYMCICICIMYYVLCIMYYV